MSRRQAGRGRRWGQKAQQTGKRRSRPAYPLGALAAVSLLLAPWGGSGAHLTLTPPQPTQMPMSDRLAAPELPESPTQVDDGRSLYYYHCMPCHGDRGQGLTDEWRQVWVEDHQNCWARGCHTGRTELDAFSIPRQVPAVSGSPQALASFQTAEELFTFLRQTQPPQRAGTLSDEEYWALTAFLLHENGRLSPDTPLGPQAGVAPPSSGDVALITLAPLLALFTTLGVRRRQ